MKTLKTLSIATLIGASGLSYAATVNDGTSSSTNYTILNDSEIRELTAYYASGSDVITNKASVNQWYELGVGGYDTDTEVWLPSSSNDSSLQMYAIATDGGTVTIKKGLRLLHDYGRDPDKSRREGGAGLYFGANSTVTINDWANIAFKTNYYATGGLYQESGSVINIGVLNSSAGNKVDSNIYNNYGLLFDVIYYQKEWGMGTGYNNFVAADISGTINLKSGWLKLNTDGSSSLYEYINSDGAVNIYGGTTHVRMNNVKLAGQMNFIGGASDVSITAQGAENIDGGIIVNSDKAVIGVYGENSINKAYVDKIGFASSDNKLTINIGGEFNNNSDEVSSQLLPVISAFAGAELVINLGERDIELSDAKVGLAGIVAAEGTSGTFDVVINGFANDMIYFESEYEITSDGFISIGDIVVQITAKDYLTGDTLANGWAIANVDGKYFLQNSVVPEAADIAVIFGAIALAFAAYRRRK